MRLEYVGRIQLAYRGGFTLLKPYGEEGAGYGEVDGTVDPDDADLVELAFEVVVPTWEAVGAVDADRRLTALGAWGLPRALARAWGGDLNAT